MLSTLVILCRETQLHDVTLACEDGQIYSFRALIALVYPILEDVLKDSDEEDLVIILPDFSKKEVDQRIDFFLYGKTEKYTPNIKTVINQMEYKHDIENQEMSAKSNDTYIELVNIDTDKCHKNRVLLKCATCGKQFLEILLASGVKNESYKQDFAKHLEIHTGLSCGEYGRHFRGNQFRTNYIVHVKKHSEIKPEKINPICEICGKIFTSLSFWFVKCLYNYMVS